MRWNWKLFLLVAVLSICVLILIAPDVALQATALRALQWMQLFFLLITGLIAVLFYLPPLCEELFASPMWEPHPLTPLRDVFSLRC
jgi:hypothetical protein